MTLGFDIHVSRPAERLTGPDDPRINTVGWSQELLLDEHDIWLGRFMETGDAAQIANGHGYPDQYLIRAERLLPFLTKMDGTSASDVAVLDELKLCEPDEWLLATSWDRS